jgi:hypothetical protein
VSLEHSPARSAKRAEVNDPSLTVDQFCRAENISRSMLYRAWAEGWGPKFYWVGTSRRIITHSSRLEWQREREAEAAAERGAQRDLSSSAPAPRR